MIGSLRGRLIERSEGEVLVEVAGVGYRVTSAPTTVVGLGDVGDEVFVWTHHHVREDAETLYGFASRDERATFEALLGAHGVGPALALGILSVHSPSGLARILLDDDVASLCLVPGVGKKTAARLLIELKSRLDIPETAIAVVSAGGGNGAASSAPLSARADVRAALDGLGYSAEEIRSATTELPQDGDAGELLRLALARLSGAR
ncbi:MAG TPA: Holliday junction branch migration protein RuvA [Acidimicrobiales bacterium]|jgi:Holliday junction DNA helicase RuvA